MYRKLPQSVGGNTLKEMVIITIGDHIKTKDPLIEEDTLVEDPMIEMEDPLEEDTLVENPLMEVEDPLMKEEDPLDLPEGKDHQALKDHLGL